MATYNFSPPMLDFSPLGRLGETYDRSVKQTREADIAANREKVLAGFGQNGDLAALGTQLLRAGDIEGGMSALRLHAANEGSPYQRSRAAAEDARVAADEAYRRRQEERHETERKETLERADRPVRVTEPGVNEFGDATRRQGWQYPNGVIKWEDGTETRAAPGPQSGGAGDPNLPAPLSAIAGGPPLTEAGQPEYGYAIPGTGQRFPHGTILPPKGDTATAVQAPAVPVVVPGAANLPAQGAQQNQALPVAAPVAAPAGKVAVAAPPTPEPAVPATPLTATQINQGTSNIAPMTNAEMIAEARRIGISPGQYRAARAAAIQKEMIAKSGGPDPEKNLGEQAGKLAVAEQYLANAPQIRDKIAKGEQTGLWDRTMAVNNIGEQGHIQGLISSGVDALVHMMTGAGMSAAEAQRKVGRYEPALLDTPERLGEHDQLVSELTHWRELAYRGKGAPSELPKPAAPYGAGTNSITLDNGIKATW